MSTYLTPHPTDSTADDLLKRMLSDYKAEIRRRYKHVDFSKLPIVCEAERYLQARFRADNNRKQHSFHRLQEQPMTSRVIQCLKDDGWQDLRRRVTIN